MDLATAIEIVEAEAKLSLHKITGRARKCVPSALSAVTGASTHDIAAIMRDLLDRPAIHSASMEESALTLTALCYGVDLVEHNPAPTLRRWVMGAEPGRYIVRRRGHQMAVAVGDGWGHWADSRNRDPRPIDTAPLKCRITHSIRVRD